MNRIFAFLLLIFSLPLFVFIAIMIIVFSGFPIFFYQKRIGLNKKEFNIHKFRSIKNNKVTSIGKIIRKFGIDELPQLWNIIKGEMNFIGPRPLTTDDIIRLNWTSIYYNQRWTVKPGITGLAQLTNICNKKISWFYDKYYVNNKSFCLDLKILLKSILIPIFGKKNKIIK